jgi:hypothetical protein
VWVGTVPAMTVAKRSARADPDHPGVMVGWPRPLVRTAADVLLPHAWVAELHYDSDYDTEPVQHPADASRGTHAIQDWRCQVCGEDCPALAYAPVKQADCTNWPPVFGGKARVEVSAGALCSIRCAQLALAVCPHLARMQSAVISFRRADTYVDVAVHEAVLTVFRWSLI